MLVSILVCRPGAAAKLVVVPDSGNGRPGEALTVRGSGYPASATIMITVGGAATFPEAVVTDAKGRLAATVILLAEPIPAGRYAARVVAGETHVFEGAYTVRPIVSLDPPIGDGRAGATWRTDEKIATGGYTGMVFVINGAGFPAGSFISGDSISVGNAPAIHDPIRIGDDGVLRSTTIVVASDLAAGRYDLSLHHGSNRFVFAAKFHVAPWAATAKVRRRGAGRKLSAARDAIRDLVRMNGKFLPPEEIATLDEDVKKANDALKTGDFEKSEDISRRIRDKTAVLKEQADKARADKFDELADVIAAGFDRLQPPGSPPNRQAAKTIGQGREALDEARAAIEKGDFDAGGTLLKAANATLKKAQKEAGAQETSDEPIRW